MLVINKKIKLDYLVIAMIGLLCLGSLGGAFQPVRIFVICMIPYLIKYIFDEHLSWRASFIYVFFSWWFIYSIFSISWAPLPKESFRHIVYQFINSAMFLLLLLLAKNAKNPFQAIVFGWFCAVSLTLPIAIYEFLTDKHLSISGLPSDIVINTGYDKFLYRYVDTTFGDLNAYSTFLCYSLFFLLAYLLHEVRLVRRLIVYIVVFLIYFFIFFNASRGAILSSCILLIFYIYFSVKKRIADNNIEDLLYACFAFIVILILSFLLFSYVDLSSFRLMHRIEIGGLDEDNARINIYRAAWESIVNYSFVGVGAGSQEYALNEFDAVVASAHNLMLEVFVQYGLVIFLGFSFLIFIIFFPLIKEKNNVKNFLAYSFLGTFLPLFVVVSGYLLDSSFWIFLSSLFFMGERKSILKINIK